MYDVWSKYRQNRRQILSVLPSTFGPWPKECSAHTHTHTHTHTYKHPHTCVEYMTAVQWICVDSAVCYQERTAQADRKKKKTTQKLARGGIMLQRAEGGDGVWGLSYRWGRSWWEEVEKSYCKRSVSCTYIALFPSSFTTLFSLHLMTPG